MVNIFCGLKKTKGTKIKIEKDKNIGRKGQIYRRFGMTLFFQEIILLA